MFPRSDRTAGAMEAVLKEIAGKVALTAELICVLCITMGGVLAVIKGVTVLIERRASHRTLLREVWMTFAAWIILALEFALGADIVRTAIAPTWNDIGQLASIAVIRTALNYFLERDLEAFQPTIGAAVGPAPASPAEPPRAR